MDSNQDTIAAIASALGGALAIVRVSGPRAVAVVDACWRGRYTLAETPGHRLVAGDLVDDGGAILDQAAAVRYEPGTGYTGEPAVELFTHGGRMAARLVLRRLLECGARAAGPGEFTRRAFLNGKLDLVQAEAVADVISAQSERSLRVAQRQLAGVFGRQVAEQMAQVEELLAEAEARLDFPEEQLTHRTPAELTAVAREIRAALERMLASRHTGEVLRHGYRVVIAGPPNAGKSSLLNALLGRERAIVTPEPGTTRDLLEEQILLRGWPVCLVDTAGLRDTADLAETAGVQRAREAAAAADAVLWLLDGALPAVHREPPPDFGRIPVLQVLNKADLSPKLATRNPQPTTPSLLPPTGHRPQATDLLSPPPIPVSAKTAAGLETLLDCLEEILGARTAAEPEFAVNERQARLLDDALVQTGEALEQLAAGSWERAAVNWRGALQALGQILGRIHAPDILDAVFARFCIGK